MIFIPSFISVYKQRQNNELLEETKQKLNIIKSNWYSC